MTLKLAFRSRINHHTYLVLVLYPRVVHEIQVT